MLCGRQVMRASTLCVRLLAAVTARSIPSWRGVPSVYRWCPSGSMPSNSCAGIRCNPSAEPWLGFGRGRAGHGSCFARGRRFAASWSVRVSPGCDWFALYRESCSAGGVEEGRELEPGKEPAGGVMQECTEERGRAEAKAAKSMFDDSSDD